MLLNLSRTCIIYVTTERFSPPDTWNSSSSHAHLLQLKGHIHKAVVCSTPFSWHFHDHSTHVFGHGYPCVPLSGSAWHEHFLWMSSTWLWYLWSQCPQQPLPTSTCFRWRIYSKLRPNTHNWPRGATLPNDPPWQRSPVASLTWKHWRSLRRWKDLEIVEVEPVPDYRKSRCFEFAEASQNFGDGGIFTGLFSVWPTARAHALLCPVQTAADARWICPENRLPQGFQLF